MGAFGMWHVLILALVALVLFGGNGKVSDLMGDFGKGMNSFKKGLSEPEEDPHVINAEPTAQPRTANKDSRPALTRRSLSMFDLFSWSHILILLVVALVVVGPKDLPRLMHMAGRWAGKARGMANEFKKSFDDMARQERAGQIAQGARSAAQQAHHCRTSKIAIDEVGDRAG